MLNNLFFNSKFLHRVLLNCCFGVETAKNADGFFLVSNLFDRWHCGGRLLLNSAKIKSCTNFLSFF